MHNLILFSEKFFAFWRIVLNLLPHPGGCEFLNKHAKIAQLVERHLAKVEVAGSNPVFRSKSEYPLNGSRISRSIGTVF